MWVSHVYALKYMHVLIHAGAECKRHKIKCDQVTGEDKCAKCLRSGAECVPYNMNQRLLEEDTAFVIHLLVFGLNF